MTTIRSAVVIAQQRQLDWLLGEVLGSEAVRARAPAAHLRPWLAAALLALGLAAAFGTALLRDESASAPAQEPVPEPVETIEWYECHGPARIDQIPADVVNLKCFDFDDAAMVHLGHFAKLLRLDLSGMDVNERGYAVSLKITDAGLFHLNGVLQLRWLSLAGCHEVKGPGLRALENLPQLEHLDLTYSGVESPAIERLPELFSLRELSLSHCMNFHGRSLAEVAKVAGLRRLALRGCTTLAAADVMPLAKLTQLRHLDLRDCQGRFRGQRASGFGTDDEEPPPPPVEDGIGITDACLAALGDLKLETLLLGGSESLTDAIGATLAKMTTLRTLDLSNLPKTTNAVLADVPDSLTSLRLDDNHQFTDAGLRALPALPALRELGLGASPELSDRGIADLLAGRRLAVLALGGVQSATKVGELFRRTLAGELVDAVATQRELRSLDLQRTRVDSRTLRRIAALPALAELNLTSSIVLPGGLDELARATTLHSLNLTWVEGVAVGDLGRTAPNLRQLNLYGTKLDATAVREALASRHELAITMPDGQRYRVP
jgi:hypothetical protein